jgi:hypothetical protein
MRLNERRISHLPITLYFCFYDLLFFPSIDTYIWLIVVFKVSILQYVLKLLPQSLQLFVHVLVYMCNWQKQIQISKIFKTHSIFKVFATKQCPIRIQDLYLMLFCIHDSKVPVCVVKIYRQE